MPLNPPPETGLDPTFINDYLEQAHQSEALYTQTWQLQDVNTRIRLYSLALACAEIDHQPRMEECNSNHSFDMTKNIHTCSVGTVKSHLLRNMLDFRC